MAHAQVEEIDHDVLELGSGIRLPHKPKPTWLGTLATVVRTPNHSQIIRRNAVFNSQDSGGESDSTTMVLKTWTSGGVIEQTCKASSSEIEQKIEPVIAFRTRDRARRDFIFAVTGTRMISMPALSIACIWYLDHLENKIKAEWTTLFQPVLANIQITAYFPSEKDIAVAFDFLSAAVIELKCVDVALTDICDFAYNEDLLRFTDSNRTEATQLVFAVVGWITSMYSSKRVHNSEFLEISSPSSKDRPTTPTFGYKRVRHRVQTDSKLHMEDWRDKPLHSLLLKIGNFLPVVIVDATGEETDICFDKNLLSFDRLCRVGCLEIEWVESVCLHGEFNHRTKILKLFKFPSLCLLLLVQSSSASSWFELNENTEVRQYYYEVLLSYRLLFGADKASTQLFNKLATNGQDSWGSHTDPLLAVLCGNKGGKAKDIYDTIEADCGVSSWSTSDFAFLGTRLLKLQNFMRAQCKLGDEKTRRRDRYYLVRLLISDVFSNGGTTVLFLTFCQFLLQIFQVIYAKQQVNVANKLQ